MLANRQDFDSVSVQIDRVDCAVRGATERKNRRVNACEWSNSVYYRISARGMRMARLVRRRNVFPTHTPEIEEFNSEVGFKFFLFVSNVAGICRHSIRR